MAAKSGFGIDIGQDSIKLVQLRQTKTGIQLSRVKVLKTEITPSLARAERENIIAERVSEIIRDVNVGKSPLTIATPGISAFIRYIKLPPVSQSRLQQIIGYEAQQQVPFPLEEVIWDYQILKTAGKSETTVILVAIKSEVVEKLLNVIGSRGLDASAVEHRPLALYNCVRLNEETEGDVTIIIDVGATATDLSIEREGELCWTRSARIGGQDITEAIQNAFHTSFEEAEKLKRDKGIIYLSEDEEKSAEGESKRLWEAMRPVVQEMGTELQRSVSYFHSQLEGERIDKVLLTGGCSRLRNFDSFIREQLGTDVKKLDPLKKIAFSPEVLEGEDLESELGVAIGLALRSIGRGFSTIDLLPKVLIVRRELQKKRVYLMLSGLSMALMLGVSATFAVQNHNVMQLQVQNISDELKQYERYDSDIRKIKAEQKKVQKKIDILKALVVSRDYWPNILLEFSRILPDNTVLTSISILDEEKELLELKGRTTDFDAVTHFISCLEQSSFFRSVEVKSAKQVEEIVTGTREPGDVSSSMPRLRTPRGRSVSGRETRVEERRSRAEVRKARVDFLLHVELSSTIPLKEIPTKTVKEKVPEWVPGRMMPRRGMPPGFPGTRP